MASISVYLTLNRLSQKCSNLTLKGESLFLLYFAWVTALSGRLLSLALAIMVLVFLPSDVSTCTVVTPAEPVLYSAKGFV